MSLPCGFASKVDSFGGGGELRMNLSTEDEPDVDRQFHWLPFTVAYWVIAAIVAIVLGDAWVLFGLWLANPVVLAAAWILWMWVIPRLSRERRPEDAARRI
jgi:Flp pilus assembly protein TadB